jgi:hypothetical protein
MLAHIEAAELGSVRTLLDAYDRRTAQAIDVLLSDMPPEAAQEIHVIIADGTVEAERAWRLAMRADGQNEAPRAATDADSHTHVRQSASVASGLVLDAGAEDDEHPNYGGGPSGSRVQRKLSKMMDQCTREGFCAHHQLTGSALDCERLEDLADAGTSHSWLWAVTKAHGPVIDDDLK